MSQHILRGKKIAILVADGFEQIEMTEPRQHLEKAGAETVLVSPNQGKVKAWNEGNWGDTFPVDSTLKQTSPDQFDALLLPGGVQSPDTLRMNLDAVRFVKAFFLAGKPVAAICHGPWPLIDAGVLKDRSLTSYPSLKADLANAGAKWTDHQVVIDNGLVTSRNPKDLPAFKEAMVDVFAQEYYDLQRPPEALRPVAGAR
jgi:protease I